MKLILLLLLLSTACGSGTPTAPSSATAQPAATVPTATATPTGPTPSGPRYPTVTVLNMTGTLAVNPDRSECQSFILPNYSNQPTNLVYVSAAWTGLSRMKVDLYDGSALLATYTQRLGALNGAEIQRSITPGSYRVCITHLTGVMPQPYTVKVTTTNWLQPNY